MAFSFNPDTRQITLPIGDTADLYVNVNWDGLSERDAILFAIFDPDANGDLLCKAADLEGGRAHIRLCNQDTRDLQPGTYRWQLRIVTDPARDETGRVIADDCTDHVITVFDDIPRIKLNRGGAYV